MTNLFMCEACLTSPVAREVENEIADRPFKVCEPCAHRLENLALRPLEWYRLSALHGPQSFLLHDDFYDHDGTAEQNRIAVKQASLFKAPKLADVSVNLDALLDYSMTRWHLGDATLAAFLGHEATDVLARLSAIVEDRPVPWVEMRCYEIAATVLGPIAEQWVRSRWKSGSRAEVLYSFMQAVAACMPPEEAIPMALEAIDRSGVRNLSGPAMPLARFHSPQVIDWIENRVTSPVPDGWGTLAAHSGLSWATVTRWLDQGRPMSLVAMDALGVIMLRDRDGRRSIDPINLKGAPSDDAILALLREHALRDPVPRVTQIVDRIFAASAKP